MIIKRHFIAGPSGAQPRNTPLGHPSVTRRRPPLARGVGSGPSTPPQPAAAAHS